MCASMSPETLYQFTGYSIVLRKREFILKCVAGSHVKLATAALRCTAAARSHVQCLTKPSWFDCASITCGAVMAARESEEDNK